VRELLDAPNEFFFNRSTSVLYFAYNGAAADTQHVLCAATATATAAELNLCSGTGPPPSDASLVATQAQTLLTLQGTQAAPVVGVTVKGITFRDAASTYMSPHGVPSCGDWALQRSGGLFLSGTERVTITNCRYVKRVSESLRGPVCAKPSAMPLLR